MSKYYKAEDVIRAIDDAFDSIPMEQTIEILKVRKTIRSLPTIEVSEDAISRANLIESFLADNECKREEAKACMCSLDSMLELIEDEPSVLPQVPSEDAISREWVLSQGKYYYNGKGEQEYAIPIGIIKSAPSVTPQPKEGEWKSIKASIYPYGYDVECSICGHRMGSSFGYKFCPMCGSKMKGASDDTSNMFRTDLRV